MIRIGILAVVRRGCGGAVSAPSGLHSDSEFARTVDALRNGGQTESEAVEHLLALMCDAEKLWLFDGDVGLYRGIADTLRAGYNTQPVVAGAVGRLGLPGIRFTDGPRGVVIGHSTAFPAAIARAATWDPDLEVRVGHAIGAEARAQGANFFAGICVNLLRHPGWGRAQECYGEDPVLLGAMGAALTRGAGEHVMTCVKHFALNSIEEARFRIDVEVDEQTLHEVYLPHFKTVLAAGATAVMTAYNSVNGQWCGDSRALIGDILRDQWSFDGLIVTDFVWGMRDPVGSLIVGQDVELPFRQQRARTLPPALRDGRLDIADVDRSARRVLRTQLRHAASLGDPPGPDCVASAEHRALAREVAVRGTVLLRNEVVGETPVLPLAGGPLAVIGELAAAPNLGDVGSSAVRSPSTSSIFDGLREVLGGSAIRFDIGSDPVAAAAAAANAKAAVVVVGLSAADEGESFIATEPAALQLFGPPFSRPLAARLLSRALRVLSRRLPRRGGDRRNLGLRAHDVALIGAVAAAQPRTVIVLIGGSAILAESWRHDVAAILMAWYPGMDGGRALADVLLGHREPGGRLPLAIPTTATHLPVFDPDANHAVYDQWWGQRKLDRDGNPAAYPLGFGLGYTRFAIHDLTVDASDGHSIAGIRATNTGERDGSTVIQLYAVDEAEPQPVHRLVGFVRVTAAPGQTVAAVVPLDEHPYSRYNPSTRAWSRRPGRWTLHASQHAHDPDAVVLDLR